MIRLFFTTILLLLAAFVVQQFMPAFTGLYHSRILIVHLTFLCCALASGQPAMLVLAFIGGFLWDAQCTIGPHPGDPTIYNQAAESLRFGYSILLFAAAGYLMQVIQPLFHHGKWILSTIFIGIAIALYLTLEFALINAIRGEFTISRATFLQILLTSLFTMPLAPPLLKLLSLMSEACDSSQQPDIILRRRHHH